MGSDFSLGGLFGGGGGKATQDLGLLGFDPTKGAPSMEQALTMASRVSSMQGGGSGSLAWLPQTPSGAHPPMLPAQVGGTVSGAKITHYGYPGDSSWDSASGKGIGDRSNYLSDRFSVALTRPMRQHLFGGSGEQSTGRVFEWGGQKYRDDDTAPEGDMRIDIYNPTYAGLDKGVSPELAARRRAMMPAQYAGR